MLLRHSPRLLVALSLLLVLILFSRPIRGWHPYGLLSYLPDPYYATYPEDGVTGNCKFSHEEWDAPHQPTLMVLTKEVFKDPAGCKTVVDQFPTPGEMAIVLEAEKDDEILRLKASLGSSEILSFAASAGFERGLSMHQTQEEFAMILKNILNFMPGAQDRLTEGSSLVAQTEYSF
ncbi:hypothetical protein Tco_0932257 [Tanacetum coccineum]